MAIEPSDARLNETIERVSMRKIILATALTVIGVALAGCQTLVYTPEEQAVKNSRIRSLNRRMLAADVDALLMLEQPSHLTPWIVRDHIR